MALTEERSRPSRNVDLTPEQDVFVADAVACGRYRDADEVLRDAVALLQRRWAIGDAVLRGVIAAGLASLDRGAFTDVEDEDLDRYLDALAATPNA